MIQHVGLEIARDQVEDCVAFYALLGFEQAEPPASLRDRAAWVSRGGTQVHLLFVDEPQAPAAGHVAVLVDDYAVTVEALREAGHDVDPRREHWGASRAYVRDPAGNIVELMASPPASG